MRRHDGFIKAGWLVPTGLIGLSLIPIAVGSLRLWQIGGGAALIPDNARFAAAPWPVVLHVIGAAVYCVLGAFQFAHGWRRRHPGWHRIAGRVLVPCGLVAALSGLWMAQFYPVGTEPPASFDGPLLYAIRLGVGLAMAGFLGLGLVAVRRRDFGAHQAWMMRAYALGLGAGTQVLTHLPWFLWPAIQGEAARALLMGAGWAINLAVAQWLIVRSRRLR